MRFKVKEKKDRIRNYFAIFPKQIGDTIVWLGWWHESQYQVSIGNHTYWSVYGEYVGYGRMVNNKRILKE